MTPTLYGLVGIVVLAVPLDILFVIRLQRFRKLKRAAIDKDGFLKNSHFELLRQAFSEIQAEAIQ